MDIEKIKVLRGPNFWSNYRKKLIELKLNLKKYEQFPTNLLPTFNENLKNLIPSLIEHHCSYQEPTGFFKRLKEGTWLGHVVEHVAIELQILAGMNCGFGRTRAARTKGVYYVLFSYEYEEAGIYAAKAAVKLVKTLAEDKIYHELTTDLQALHLILQKEKLGPSTLPIIEEARKRKIPYTKLDHHLFILGHGCNQKRIWSTVTQNTSLLAADIAQDKALTKKVLADAGVSVPHGTIIETEDELLDSLQKIPFPVVIKPFNSNHGNGVSTNINHFQEASTAFQIAKKIANQVIVEQFIHGLDFRFLVINYKLVAVANRTPAMIVGDGKNSIKELINQINKSKKRGIGHEKYLSHILIDDITEAILLKNNLPLDSILPLNHVLFLKNSANLSTGGTAIDVTNIVHPFNIDLSERIARLMQLDICGIDIICKRIDLELTPENGAVVEVNAAPGLRMHLDPDNGCKANIGEHILDMLYPNAQTSLIPITAITGTNGKTTIARLIAHVAKQSGRHVGLTTTEGIYINNKKIITGDCSGPHSARVVLQDPLVDFAVFETARGGILREGLAFDHCHVSIVNNISEDHLGLEDIHSLEDLARVKSVVPRSTYQHGYAVLNADDDLVYGMIPDLDCQIALFSLFDNNLRIIEHCRKGGLAAYIKEDILVLRDGNKIHDVLNVNHLPITLNGTAQSMIKNLLPTILACVIHQFDVHSISHSLINFPLTPENIPGRMNIFDFNTFKVMIDYAHNVDAYIHLKKYFDQIKSSKKIGIIAATGDRRPQDIQKIGFYAGQIFDEIIIRHDLDNRGKTKGELSKLLKDGIYLANPKVKVIITSNELDAIKYALAHVINDSFIFYFPDNILTAVSYIQKEHQAVQSMIT